MKRACGVLLPVSSLPGDYGIGTFSKNAYEFVGFLEKAGQSYWQILPLAPTGYGDSPYQSSSAFAGNANYISLEYLAENCLLEKKDIENICWGDEEKIDYGIIWENREKLLYKAFLNFLNEKYKERPVKSGTDLEAVEDDKGEIVQKMPYEEGIIGIKDFFDLKEKLSKETKEFCLFQAIKKRNSYKPWYEWEDDLKFRDKKTLEKFRAQEKELILFYEWLQVIFNVEWKKIKDYANDKNIEIIGDMPIYVSLDSCDSWANEKLFLFDEDKKPKKVAGCPPDYFSPEGQLWGNPIYDWDYHKATDYDWWKRRFEYNLELYDYIRLDHFRGFDEFYTIDADAKNAVVGKWEKGPGLLMFNTVQKQLKDRYDILPVIAEDMGLLTDSVIEMVKESRFPSMKVLEFAFDTDDKNVYLPHNYERNCVAYTGTHDNTTIKAWIDSLNPDTRQFMVRYLGAEYTPEQEMHLECIRTLLASVADTVIIPLQDYLGLGEFARINTPGTVGDNWKWRLNKDAVTDSLIEYMIKMAGMYSRKN